MIQKTYMAGKDSGRVMVLLENPAVRGSDFLKGIYSHFYPGGGGKIQFSIKIKIT